jgi:hypothetical protein
MFSCSFVKKNEIGTDPLFADKRKPIASEGRLGLAGNWRFQQYCFR